MWMNASSFIELKKLQEIYVHFQNPFVTFLSKQLNAQSIEHDKRITCDDFFYVIWVFLEGDHFKGH